MKTPRTPATLPEVIPTLLCGNIIIQHGKILTLEIDPSRLLKEAKREPPNKLMKTKGSTKKDVKNEGTSQ